MPPSSFNSLKFFCKILFISGLVALAACTSSTQQDSESTAKIAAPLPTTEDFFTDKLSDGQAGPSMVKLPTYFYQRGCLVKGDCYADAKPVRKVTILAGTSLMTHEVTFDQYNQFVQATGNESPDDRGWGRGSRPVINIAWDDAVAYAEWLSEQTGQNYQLPTEAVWEYAARAGSSTFYSFGNDAAQLCEYANVADITEANQRNGNPLVKCDDSYGKGTAPVGSYKPNAFGIYDMSGNVREWVQDCYHDNYRNAPVDGSARLDTCDTEDKVLRGGAWFSFPWINSSSTRQNAAPFIASFSIGFRLMRIDAEVN